MFEFIAYDDWLCSKPDEVDRDVRHGQVTQDHDDDDVCMYVRSSVKLVENGLVGTKILLATSVRVHRA